MSLHEIVPKVVSLAQRAGGRIMGVYNSAVAMRQKSNDSPVTIADIAAHQTLSVGLRQIIPGLPVLSEETAMVPFAERKEWERYWLIDPLDGTKEFLKRNGEFTVNVALIENHRPILGVVWVPAHGVGYFAVAGGGAFRQFEGKIAEPIRIQPLRWRPVKVVGSRSHVSPDMDKFLKKLGNHEMIAVGSSLKFCQVAEGKADVYPRLMPTAEWDTAAPQCILEEAGGKVLSLVDGKPLSYNHKDSILNPNFVAFGDDGKDWLKLLS